MESLRSAFARSAAILSLFAFALLNSGCAPHTTPHATPHSTYPTSIDPPTAHPLTATDAHDHGHDHAPPLSDALTLEQRFDGLHIAQIEVLGMSCPLCAHNISRQLEKIPAVKKTHINLGTGIVSVGLAPDETWPSVDALKNAVDKAGYTVGEVTVPPRETKDADTSNANTSEANASGADTSQADTAESSDTYAKAVKS